MNEREMLELAAMAETVQKMREALLEVEGLISESAGVYGMHLNGDPSPWEELLKGGMFERLSTLHEALALPDQSADVINRIKAQGMMEAAELHNSEDVLAPVGHSPWGEARQEGWIEGTAAYRDAIRTRAAELEGSDGRMPETV